MRLLVTAGPTREYLDTVRFISNPSSGRMGYALARVARRRGHTVTLISGPVALRAPAGLDVIQVETAEEMLRACVRAFRACDAAIMTAAVCDYRPVHRSPRKVAKRRGPFALALEATTDICARLGRTKGKRVVVGFALEDHDHRSHAETKRREKHCDVMVLNDPGTVGSAKAVIEILTADGQWHGPFRGAKSTIASRILSIVEELV